MRVASDGSPARRAFVAAAACALLVLPRALLAQDAKSSTVQLVAREWLKLVDALDGVKSWQASGPTFKRVLTEERWSQGLARERERRGKVVQRAMVTTTFASQFPGLPPKGIYALISFRTVYEKGIGTSESVTLEQGSDGVWRVVGYVIS
jgi:hypothetical protein